MGVGCITDITNVVLGVRKLPQETDIACSSRIEELIGLCDAAGAKVVQVLVQERAHVDGTTYLGSGKIKEMAAEVSKNDLTLAIFDGELSPGQLRNLEQALDCRVIDRTQLILDIFAVRARTREGRLQVEIAQLQYLLPRLTGRGVEMSRLGGGIGTRGPGETKLEVDRRRIRQRIGYLRAQLEVVRRQRGVQRERRGRTTPVVALVGYTNAGKTSLLKKWTEDEGVPYEGTGNNRLFDTLDPVARRVKAGATGELILLDTVGFVQQLPHLLIDAFRATLEEVLAADVIVHVVDSSVDPYPLMQTTYEVLGELGALDKPIVTFFNKMDAAKATPMPDTRASQSVYGSVIHGTGVQTLYEAVERMAGLDPVRLTLDGPLDNAGWWAWVSKNAKVVDSTPLNEEFIRVSVDVERRIAARFQEQLNRLTNQPEL